MPIYLKLRKEAGELIDEAKAIQAAADEENRKLTEEEDERIGALLATLSISIRRERSASWCSRQRRDWCTIGQSITSSGQRSIRLRRLPA